MNRIKIMVGVVSLTLVLSSAAATKQTKKMNVLYVISDDLTATALSCYGNSVCRTPHIDKLAERGTRFTRTFCQTPFCGPSRASIMFGYYPHATGTFGYVSGRKGVGPNRDSWPQHFMKNGYHTARVSKVFHMGVPINIERGGNGEDDAATWNERYNCKGPEWRAPGDGETLEGTPNAIKPAVGGNTFVVVEADGDDLVHSDGKTAKKASELIHEYKKLGKPWFLGVGFVRPHVPFVAPRKYFENIDYSKIVLPPKVAGDWDDLPRKGINNKNSRNMKMDERRQRKAVGGYYASVQYMDAMVGNVINALNESGQRDNTIVIFTSDHGYHLGEHDFWAKVSMHEESAKVPMIICVPGKKPAVCGSLTELIDLYPTLSSLCGLDIPPYIQGKDISEMLDEPKVTVRDVALCANNDGIMLRDKRWAYLSYAGTAEELYDMERDPNQYTNLINNPEYQHVLKSLRKKAQAKLAEVRSNDLNRPRALSQPTAKKVVPTKSYRSGQRMVMLGRNVTCNAAFIVDLEIPESPRGTIVELGGNVFGSWIGFTSNGDLHFHVGNGSSFTESESIHATIPAAKAPKGKGALKWDIDLNSSTLHAWWNDTLIATAKSDTKLRAWSSTSPGGVGKVYSKTVNGAENSPFNGKITGPLSYYADILIK